MWTATQQQLAKSSGPVASCAERAEARQGRVGWGGVGESRPDCDARGTGVGVRVTQEATRHFLGDTGGTHLCTRDAVTARTRACGWGGSGRARGHGWNMRASLLQRTNLC